LDLGFSTTIKGFYYLEKKFLIPENMPFLGVGTGYYIYLGRAFLY
jgi:hypothetical protein